MWRGKMKPDAESFTLVLAARKLQWSLSFLIDQNNVESVSYKSYGGESHSAIFTVLDSRLRSHFDGFILIWNTDQST